MIPKILLSERDFTLINEKHCLQASNFHINKNVKAMCEILMNSLQTHKVVVDA